MMAHSPPGERERSRASFAIFRDDAETSFNGIPGERILRGPFPEQKPPRDR